MKRKYLFKGPWQLIWPALIALLVYWNAEAEPVTRFELIEDPPEGVLWFNAVSGDGSVLVGSIGAERWEGEAILWKDNTITRLGDLPGGEFDSRATGVSSDGRVVIGVSSSEKGEEPFRWEDGTLTGLGLFPGAEYGEATAVSSNGSVVVGYCWGGILEGDKAFLWENGTMTDLGALPEFTESRATDISADGTVVVGSSWSETESKAFRWENGVMTGLDGIAGGLFSAKTVVSADGSRVLGRGEINGRNALILLENGVTTPLEPPNGNGVGWLYGLGISGDGSIVVVTPIVWDDPPVREPLIWSAANDWEPLGMDTYLGNHGMRLGEWTTNRAGFVMISEDASTLIGRVRDTFGETYPFRLRTYEADFTNRRFVNVSTRGLVETGDHVMIGSFIVQGGGPKTVLIRGIGPSLAGAIDAPVLNDPELTLVNCANPTVEIVYNDDWRDTQEAVVLATGIPPGDDAEAALIVELQPGAYSAILSGVNETTGYGLIEVYEVDYQNEARIVNVSTRCHVGTGDRCMIGGFAVEGDQPSRVYIRVTGPSLPDNIDNKLANPVVELYNGQTRIGMNDDWMNDDQKLAVLSTGLPPVDEKEAALIATLDPGLYTAIVSEAQGTSGYVLLEIYYYHDQ